MLGDISSPINEVLYKDLSLKQEQVVGDNVTDLPNGRRNKEEEDRLCSLQLRMK